MLKKLALICLAIIFALAISSSRTLAQSSAALESRLSRLESENFQLRAQVNRIETQIAALGGRSLPRQPPAPTLQRPPTPPRTSRQSSSDPMFDRLATLVIELKERVQALEAQVAQLRGQRR